MSGNTWEYDTVYFIGQIRRSGGSLVITIPNELRNRFLITEGQKVRIIGVTRRRPHVEGGLLIFLGRFSVIEEVEGYTIKVRIPENTTIENAKEELYTYFTEKLNATNLYIEEREGEIKVEAFFGQITENEIIPREDDIESIGNEIKRFLERNGYKLVELKKTKEIQRWNTIDPSIIKRYTTSIPESISFEWRIT